MTREDKIKHLLAHPEELLLKKPFTRGSADFCVEDCNDGRSELATSRVAVSPPKIRKRVVSQARFAKELDPDSHEVMFDGNLPSICVKLQSGGYHEIIFKRMGLPFQKRIREKQTLSLCGNPILHTLRGSNPADADKSNFAVIKEYWTDRNQDGMVTKAVYTQLGYGDAGLLYYHNSKGEIKSRLISYEDGYVIIPHNDDNGERLMECVYYEDAEGIEHIDCYTDDTLYLVDNNGGWGVKSKKKHGFKEIPLATKRGDVAWNDVQSLIDVYEILYNIYLVIQKRHGWGILYIKGRINEQVKKLAGSIVLQDTSHDGTGSAEFKTPPSPQGILDTLQSLLEQIQYGSSTTFILPKDVKSSGDVSALAIMLTQELDIEGATNKVIEWQNFIDKCKRLFVHGLAKELVNKGEIPDAVTAFSRLKIGSRFKIWRPFNETEYNQMLATLKGAGILSKKTAIEKNTMSQPDEEQRISIEEEEARKLQQQINKNSKATEEIIVKNNEE